MKIFRINEFEGGWIADFDPIDQKPNSAIDIKNMIIRPGYIKSRPKSRFVESTGFTAPKSFAEFKVLTTGNTTSHFLIIKDDTGLKKSIYSSGYGVPAAISEDYYDGDSGSEKVTFLNVQGNIHGCRGGLDADLRTY